MADAAQIWRYWMARLLREVCEATERACVGADSVHSYQCPPSCPLRVGSARTSLLASGMPSMVVPQPGAEGIGGFCGAGKIIYEMTGIPYQTACPDDHDRPFRCWRHRPRTRSAESPRSAAFVYPLVSEDV